MAYAKVTCAALRGVGGQLVDVEADLAGGLPAVILTGLPDSAVTEARDRVRAAIANAGLPWPQRRITLNLHPADVRKHGTSGDLAMALAIMVAAGQVPGPAVDGVLILGELGLDGSVRGVRGALPMVTAAVRAGVRRAIVPVANAAEAALVPGVRVAATDSLRRTVDFLRGQARLADPPPRPTEPGDAPPDLADVAGQATGRLAVEVAAAGGHHLALFGTPGCGKSMLARRLPGLLPLLDDEAALEVTSIHSIAGRLPPGGALIRRPPFHAPHHTSSVVALVGGGGGAPRPGAISLAHRGLLLLDEAPEFSSRALEALRQPLEDGEVTVSRAYGSVVYPARFQLALTANPCPCARPRELCECPSAARRRYLNRLSGPLRDRIDILLTLHPIGPAHLLADDPTESSAVVARRVLAARDAAAERWSAAGHRCNGEVPGDTLRRAPWRLPAASTAELRRRLESGSLSARGFDRVLRVAWTLADLAGRDTPGAADLNVAFELRRGPS